MNTKKIALPLVVVIAVLLAFSSPAAADYSGDKPLVTYDTDVIRGDIVFETVTDNSTYTVLQAKDYVYFPPPPAPGPIIVPKPNLTQPITINIPEGATVKMARLYNYYTWSTADKGDGNNPGMPAEADIWFNGVKKVCKHGLGDGLANRDSLANPINYGNGVIQYWDSKGQGYDPACTSYARKYDNPYGTFAWDVTDMVKEGMVDGSGTYTAKITNNDTTPTTGLIDPKTGELKPYKYWERFVTWGFGLVVVYEDPSSPGIEYWIDEGCDLLLNRTCYETAESATTTAPFNGEIACYMPTKAILTTVLLGSDKGNQLQNMVSFNSNWIEPSTAKDAKSIGVNNFNVLPWLQSSDNIADFQDRSDNVVVSNAFLVVTCPSIPVEIPVDIDIRPGSCPNPLHLQSKGVLPVAVLWTDDFDVTTVDPATILLGGVAPIRWSYRDVATPFTGELCDCHDLKDDGYIDLTLKFDIQELVETLGLSGEAGNTIPLTLTGNLKAENYDKPIKGEDCIWVFE